MLAIKKVRRMKGRIEMKKVLVALSVICALGLTACDNSKEKAEADKAAADAKATADKAAADTKAAADKAAEDAKAAADKAAADAKAAADKATEPAKTTP